MIFQRREDIQKVLRKVLLLLSGVKSLRHGLEDIRGSKIDSAVDQSRNERRRLLYVVADLSFFIEHHAAVIQGLLPGRFRSHDGEQRSLLRMKFQYLLQREIGADVAVHHEEVRGAPGSYLIAEMIHAPRGSQCRELLEIPNRNAVRAGHLLDEVRQVAREVRADYQYLVEIFHFRARFYMVLYYW